MPAWISWWQSIPFNERLCLISRRRAKGLAFPRHFYQHPPENEAFRRGFPGIKSPARKEWRGLSMGVWQQTNTRWESVILFPLNKHYTHFFSTGWWGWKEWNPAIRRTSASWINVSPNAGGAGGESSSFIPYFGSFDLNLWESVKEQKGWPERRYQKGGGRGKAAYIIAA